MLVATPFWTGFSGIYETQISGISYRLELDIKEDTSLQGSLVINSQVFDLKGHAMVKSYSLYGFLLEPLSGQPLALFKAKFAISYLLLKLDFPAYELANTKPRFLIFKRRPETWVQTEA